MIRPCIWLLLLALAAPAQAEVLVATRMIRAQALIGPEDVHLVPGDNPQALTSVDQVIGQEARVTLYPGRPIRANDIAPPTLVDRNQMIVLIYRNGPLSIQTEGRALERGGLGDAIRVLNLASKTTVSARVGAQGEAVTGPN
jgi:flagella basal body P-ring formation protein FlgA